MLFAALPWSADCLVGFTRQVITRLWLRLKLSFAYLGALPSKRSTSPTKYREPVTRTCTCTPRGELRVYCRSHSRAGQREGTTDPFQGSCMWEPVQGGTPK